MIDLSTMTAIELFKLYNAVSFQLVIKTIWLWATLVIIGIALVIYTIYTKDE